ncbi:uncharacterized protein N7477_007264 [Penicillium maclennaniae]|uniref:uncharacterized protein n=1 Tax=Penicillium maclennaniae TaxID=1343394 RepID=UPI002540AB8E|nr:uncharacterized protein N7477_007264 [Penicillium maclennaniae]KAJ5664816.1 hypothetical protein N7477_007264 [Penicillium maclennaniae]
MWERYSLRPALDSGPAFMPVFLYGTAWKKEQSADLVYIAVKAGFRAIDTAAQPRHYQEDLVGDGIRRAIADGIVRREDLYVSPFKPTSPTDSCLTQAKVQTKFSPVEAQDPNNMPYHPEASVTEQVQTSVMSSLHNLRPSFDPASVDHAYIDALVIHSPLRTLELTLEAWSALETYVPHRIRNLGISNCSLPVLRELNDSPQVKVKPAVVQNRFYEDTLFDVSLRAFCRDHQIIYQSFWTLTANPDLVRSTPVQQLAAHTDISPAAALYALVVSLSNVAVLNGTKDEGRMREDLAAPTRVEEFTHAQPEQWQQIREKFRALIKEE